MLEILNRLIAIKIDSTMNAFDIYLELTTKRQK